MRKTNPRRVRGMSVDLLDAVYVAALVAFMALGFNAPAIAKSVDEQTGGGAAAATTTLAVCILVWIVGSIWTAGKIVLRKRSYVTPNE